MKIKEHNSMNKGAPTFSGRSVIVAISLWFLAIGIPGVLYGFEPEATRRSLSLAAVFTGLLLLADLAGGFSATFTRSKKIDEASPAAWTEVTLERLPRLEPEREHPVAERGILRLASRLPQAHSTNGKEIL